MELKRRMLREDKLNGIGAKLEYSIRISFIRLAQDTVTEEAGVD
jgi:hypothetical protein